MKILYVTTIGGTMVFFKNFIESLVKDGHTVDIATNTELSPVRDFYYELGCKVYKIDTSRSPLDRGNLRAIGQIKKLVEENTYDIVHCHTPIAAMCTRIACRKSRKRGTRVIYTAHGFHFFRGAPRKNWLIYYPVERLCARWTDALITINREDYAFAQKKIKAKKVFYVPGVGIDLEKFSSITVDKTTKRKELGIPDDAKLILSVGELNENKNHETMIKAIATLDNVYYVIAGKGGKEQYLRKLIEDLGITHRVKLLGYRQDVGELYRMAAIFAMPSHREGLSVALMEAMTAGLSCIVSRIRGNVDLIDENGGALFNPYSVDDCKSAVENVLKRDFDSMGKYNQSKIKNFDINIVEKMMKSIYFQKEF